MPLISQFIINESTSIEIIIPNLKNKFNYQYSSTKVVNKFDEVTLLLKLKEQKIVSATEMFAILLDTFKYDLNNALHNKIELLKEVEVGFLSYQYSIDYYHEDEAAILNYSQFALWKKNNIHTWIYNKEGHIYLEISPIYYPLYTNLRTKKNTMVLNEFVHLYKPIIVEKIAPQYAQQWMKDIIKLYNKL